LQPSQDSAPSSQSASTIPNGTADVAGISERRKKAFDFAADSTKQLIGLSTGIIALTITFAKDILGGLGPGLRAMLAIAWFVYLLAILFGSWTLLALTGTLEPVKEQETKATIRGTNVTCPSTLQIAMFLLATLLVIVVAIGGTFQATPPGEPAAIAALPAAATAEYAVAATTPGVARADALLTFNAAGRYLWTTARGRASGTYTVDRSGTRLRFAGPLSAWGEGTIAGDKTLSFTISTMAGPQHVLLQERRWMCPMFPFC
jgi:hypothetical protein